MGWPASGNSGLGTFSDSGRNRVPAPNKPTPEPIHQSSERGIPVGADLVAPLTFSGAANHDDGDDALLGAGHGLALLCSASAPVAERGGGRDRGRARRDL